MQTPSNSTRNVIIVFGLVQGAMLLLAHWLLQHNVWDVNKDTMWLVPWYTVALGVPTALQLVVTDVRDRRVWLFGLALAAVLTLTGIYTAYASTSPDGSPAFDTLAPYVLTTVIGWYVLLPFVQAYFKTGKRNPEYPELFEFAWNNIITLLIAQFFTCLFWGLLALWAALFKVIGIEFFQHVFYNKYFYYPVTATVVAFAIYLGRTHVTAVVTVRRILLAIFKGLLPLLAMISLLFLAALPVMGLKPLWATGHATALMLWLQILLIVFLNAVYQNGQGEPPYPIWLRKLVQIAVIAVPAYTALCAYSLYLRVDQYGWSTDRFWAALLVLVVGLHIVGYAIAALRPRTAWMAGIAPANIAIAAIVVTLAILVNSPLLDARRISAASQVDRLLSGRIDANKFDYAYLRFNLGRAGNNALAKLKDINDHPQSTEIRSAAGQTLTQTNRWSPAPQSIETTAEAAKHFTVFPKNETIPESFLKYVIDKNGHWQLKRCLERGQHCAVLVLDLNRDRKNDYVVYRIATRWDRTATVVTLTDNNNWKVAGALAIPAQFEAQKIEDLEAQLEKGDYGAAESRWQDMRIGKGVHRFSGEN